MSDAVIGYGVAFERNVGLPGVYEAIGELIEPGAPGLTRDAPDATHAASADAYREFISGLRDGGEVTFTLALKPGDDTQALLYADVNSDAPRSYRIVFPNTQATAWIFDGLVTGLNPALPIDDRMTLAVTIKVTGKPVIDNINLGTVVFFDDFSSYADDAALNAAWTADNGAVLTLSSGRMLVTNGLASAGNANRSFTTQPGASYVLRLENVGAGNALFRVGTAANGQQLVSNTVLPPGAFETAPFVATGATAWIGLNTNTAVLSAARLFDNIVVMRLD
ncbi:phage tail tube protein [Rhodoligotrophos defluvii]|uniref:phage tail tube protein n=1 Tax=Rhodoligotrophos defluvii TaxID=2561934 RepID=UPI0010C9A4AA|nr:phage tail tube protein [Rhodoligotrophos defluvii]